MSTPLSSLIGSGSVKEWASTLIVKRRQLVVSTLDDEVYRRKTANGASATDPADDLTNYFSVSWKRPAAIVNSYSSNQNAQGLGGPGSYLPGCTATSVPAINQNVRTLALSVTGKGTVAALAVSAAFTEGVTGTIRLEVLIDGRAVFDSTNGNYVVGAGYATAAVGTIQSSNSYETRKFARYGHVEFARSLQVFVTPTNRAIPPAVATLGYEIEYRS